MNKWIGSGFISSDIKMETLNTKDGNTMEKARFSIACQKKSKNGGANFVQVVALGNMATTINKWFSKGKGIYVECEINTGSYTNKDGKKVFTEEKVITSWEFPPIRKDEEATPVSESYSSDTINNDTHTESTDSPQSNEQTSAPDDSFMSIPDDIDSEIGELPFR